LPPYVQRFHELDVMIGMNSFACRAAWLPAGLAFGAFLGIAATAGAGLAASMGESPWVDQTDSKVRLVSGTVTRDGGSALFAGVQLRMDPGWKTYWRNPGDSGVPPAFDWSGAKNVKSAEVLYPAPHRFTDAGGTAIGYKGEVLFPVKITPERAGEPVALSVNFEYGLCKDLCIPNAVELDATLPPDLGKGDAMLLETALARVPKPAGPDTLPRVANVEAKLDGPKPELVVEALFPPKATGTDLFIDAGDTYGPVPKALTPLTDGKQRFTVVFYSAEEAAAIKGKPLRLVLVSDEGSTETMWTAD
jgi:DsbC/DsbD-like thiol-disulfide interchange protein